MQELVTTGMSGLDAQLGGGIPRGTTVLLLADPSNALSLFAEQFAAGGLAAGEQVFHFVFDRPPAGIAAGIGSLANEYGGAKGRLTIYDGYTGQFANTTNGHKEGIQKIDRKNVFGSVLNQLMAVQPGTPYRLVLDSLSGLTRKNEEEAVDFFRGVVHLGREMGGVQLVTLVRGLHAPSFETALKHAAGGVMEMGVERKGFGVYSYLQVSKLLDVRDPTRLLLFKETEKGLWLESTKRVF
ncbi:MAG TPA: RAD55 family ATPase [Candidatus Thermoplasmatota archaeon]|nr:RAD55 family ATPase [Candidatus Thermoplasmatota archaeon]